jgi:hypothetical protein
MSAVRIDPFPAYAGPSLYTLLAARADRQLLVKDFAEAVI